VIGAGTVDAAVASGTRPFTWSAGAATALPLVVVFVGTVVTMVPPRRREGGGDTVPSKSTASPPSRKWLGWLAPLAAVTGWELYCFVSQPRVDHPTLSSLIDMLDATALGKFVAFALWLALGWFLVTS